MLITSISQLRDQFKQENQGHLTFESYALLFIIVSKHAKFAMTCVNSLLAEQSRRELLVADHGDTQIHEKLIEEEAALQANIITEYLTAAQRQINLEDDELVMSHQLYCKDPNRWQLFLREVFQSHETGEMPQKDKWLLPIYEDTPID